MAIELARRGVRCGMWRIPATRNDCLYAAVCKAEWPDGSVSVEYLKNAICEILEKRDYYAGTSTIEGFRLLCQVLSQATPEEPQERRLIRAARNGGEDAFARELTAQVRNASQATDAEVAVVQGVLRDIESKVRVISASHALNSVDSLAREDWTCLVVNEDAHFDVFFRATRI